MDISYKNISHIVFPVLISLLLEHLINITDTAFLGHVGEVELGASALAGVYYMAIYMLGFGFSIGVQILIARRNGEGRYGEIGNIFGQGIGFLLLLAGLMFVFSKAVTPLILSHLIHSADIYNAVVAYLDWRVYGFFFSFVAISFRAFFIGTTQTKTLTFNSIVMVGSNVVLNYILIFGKFGIPPLGIAGAAIASSLSECISMVFYMIYMYRKVDKKKYNLSVKIRLNWGGVEANLSDFRMDHASGIYVSFSVVPLFHSSRTLGRTFIGYCEYHEKYQYLFFYGYFCLCRYH